MRNREAESEFINELGAILEKKSGKITIDEMISCFTFMILQVVAEDDRIPYKRKSSFLKNKVDRMRDGIDPFLETVKHLNRKNGDANDLD
jgi:hypothetical protein